MSTNEASRQAAIRAAVKNAPPLDPQVLTSIVNVLHEAGEREAALDARIRKVVDAAPPLSDEQRVRLRAILGTDRPAVPVPSETPKPKSNLPKLPPMPEAPYVRRPAAAPYTPRITSGVYFIRTADMIKIGTSTDIATRMRSIASLCATPLELLAAVDGSYEEESQLHRRFHHLRMHGEWFRAEQELLDFIDSLGYSQEAS